jgi:hypothetical protein
MSEVKDLLAELHSFNDKGAISLPKLQTERTILKILELTVMQRKTITAACKEVGITTETWYRWSSEGLIDGPLRSISKQISQTAYDIIIPEYANILKGLVNMALGIPPEGSTIKRVTAGEAVNAFRQLMMIVPIQPMDKANTAMASELEHVEKYQPQQIQININANADFIYTGDNSDVKMGQMESIRTSSIEGEYEEI